MIFAMRKEILTVFILLLFVITVPKANSTHLVTATKLINNVTKIQNYNISIFENDIPYNPPILTIKSGNTVTWKNYDANIHTITYGIVNTNDVAKYFNSGSIEPSQTFQYKFNSSGEFPYFCILHPSMTGKVIVK